MAETTITGLPNATLPLSGSERIPMDQDGATVDASTGDVAALVPGTNISYDPATRQLSSSTGEGVELPLATEQAAGLLTPEEKATIAATTPLAFVLVLHGADPTTARPAGAVVAYWVGDGEPQNAIDNDLWSDPGQGLKVRQEGLFR
jgi:hypothetical protein